MPLDQNPHLTVTCFGCVLVFCTINATILLLYIPAKITISIRKDDQNKLHLKRWFFLQKSASSVSWSQPHLAKRKCIGWSIGFNSWTNWTLYVVIPRSLCKIHLNDIFEMFNCWERQWIDVDVRFMHICCHSSNILGCTHCFWLFTLWLIGEDASFFFSFFTQDNEHTEVWRSISSSKICMQS